MKKSVFARTMLMAVAVTACSEQADPIATAGRPDAAVVGTEVAALKRTSVQPVSLVATATIGAKGGTIATGGAVLKIPAGALSADTEITMTVPAGDFLQVTFEPHGLTFDKPVSLQLSLRGTVAEGNPNSVSALSGVYFLDSLDENGNTTALEVVPVKVTGTNITLSIGHFSGYCVVEGKTMERCIC